MSRFDVQDEYGREWAVYEEDVAWPLCKRLAAARVKEVVLPVFSLLTGCRPVVIERPDMSQYVTLEVPAVAALVRRLTRMYDCLDYLGDQTGG